MRPVLLLFEVIDRSARLGGDEAGRSGVSPALSFVRCVGRCDRRAQNRDPDCIRWGGPEQVAHIGGGMSVAATKATNTTNGDERLRLRRACIRNKILLGAPGSVSFAEDLREPDPHSLMCGRQGTVPCQECLRFRPSHQFCKKSASRRTIRFRRDICYGAPRRGLSAPTARPLANRPSPGCAPMKRLR